MLDQFLHFISPIINQFHLLGYWVAFAVTLLETVIGIGLFFPGSSAILLMGAMAAKGYFNLEYLIIFAVIGALFGDNINYYLGRKYGLEIFEKKLAFIKTKHIQRGQRFFDRFGAKSVFLGRFIPSVKEIVPLIAGIFKMKRSIFIFWNFLGAIGWAFIWILPGYFFAQSLDLVKLWLGRIGFFLTILFLIFLIFYILKRIIIKKGHEFFLFLLSISRSIARAIYNNKQVRQLISQHQTFFDFVARRLDKHNFWGLPLTMLASSLFYIILLFSGIVEAVVKSETIVSVDVRVLNLLAIFHDGVLVKLFTWITLLASYPVVLILLLAVIIVLYLQKRKFYIWPLLLSFVGSSGFTYLSKVIIHRSRPEIAVYQEKFFAFPSEHAALAIGFYGFLMYLLMRNIEKWKTKINIFFLGLGLIFLLGFSRLYLGVHYLSDVWGGYLMGLIWLIIAITLAEYFLFKKNLLNKIRDKQKILSWLIGVVAIIFYIVYASFYHLPEIKSKLIEKQNIADVVNFFNNHQKLKYTETFFGSRQEPLSFLIVAPNEQKLIKLFEQASWQLADQVGIKSLARAGQAALWQQPYQRAPITPGFWNKEVHSFGFEKSTAKDSVRVRHHARFWKTNYIMPDNQNVYIGTASFDIGLKWGITHRIDSNIDKEREFLFHDLEKTAMIKESRKQNFVQPRLGKIFTGDFFFTDGDIYILKL